MIAPFVSLEDWQARREEVVTVDVRHYLDGRRGRDGYDAGHLPGAVYVEMDDVLAAPPSPEAGRNPLPDPEVFAAGLSAAGIGDDDVVLACDDAGGVIAARLVWMLRALGHDAALIDGGLRAYEGPLETTAPPPRPPATFTPRPWPAERLADIEAAVDPSAIVLDARDADRFAGEVEPIDPRPGRIPGARNLACRQSLRPDGRLRSDDELRARFAAVGVEDGADVVSYCGSGVTACHNLLVLEHLGLGAGRLYPGSYSQYSHTDRPVATG